MLVAKSGRAHLVLAVVFVAAAAAGCKARPPNGAQVLATETGGDELRRALTADQTAPLTPDQLAAAPEVLRLAAADQPLDDAGAGSLLTAVQAEFKDCRFSGVETTLFAKIKKALRQKAIADYTQKLSGFRDGGFSRVGFAPQSAAWKRFADYVHEMDCLGVSLHDVWADARAPGDRYYLRSARETSDARAYFQQVAWSPKAASLPAADQDGNFLRNLTSAFEFIDFLDILVNMVPNAPMVYPRQNRPIWTVYDGEDGNNMQAWRETASMADGKAAPTLKEIYGIVSRRFAGFAFRQNRVVGGGDLPMPAACGGAAAKSWLSNTKFFQASRRQVAVLRTNPLVATQWCDDGAQDPDAGMIAQYEYPSARTYAFPAATTPAGPGLGQQPARYGEYLSVELRARLDQAKAAGQLDRDDSPESKKLTQAIIEELVAFILKDWDKAAAQNPASYPYQLLMSTHPSDDFNGRSLRAWYRTFESRRSVAVAPSGVPLFLTDFNLDLYTSPEEFFEISIIAARQWGRMMAAYMRERAGGRKYFDVLLPWAVAAGCDLPVSDPAVMKKVRGWMSTKEHIDLIRTKQKFSVDQGLRAALGDACKH